MENLEGMATAGVQPADPAELVRRILAAREGLVREEAERELVERYSRGVTFLLLDLTRDRDRADDLHQETFRLAIEKVRAGELRQPEQLAAFIRQIARNLFIAEYRQGVKRPRAGAEDALAVALDPAPGPQQRLLDKENAAFVRELLEELEPRRDREILLRLFVAGHPKEEICADLGLSSLHFNRVLHRARQRLKQLLSDRHLRGRRPALPASAGRKPTERAGV